MVGIRIKLPNFMMNFGNELFMNKFKNMNYENIKQQKLIFKYEGNYDLTFVDENKDLHEESDIVSSACVDLHYLVQSCFEEPTDSIFTCSCGYPECAGIYEFSFWMTDTDVIWKVNGDYFRFNRKQYVEEVKSKITLLVDVNPATVSYEYFGLPINRDSLLMLKKSLDNYLELARVGFPRHKVILCPDENNKVYINENGKKIGFKNKCYLKFLGEDIFGQEYYMEMWMEELKKWISKIKNKDSINWDLWNEEGIKHAQQIRKGLPSSFDVWYRFQGEKKEDLHIVYEEKEDKND